LAVSPLQILSGTVVIVGNGFTVTRIVSVERQVPVPTEYVRTTLLAVAAEGVKVEPERPPALLLQVPPAGVGLAVVVRFTAGASTHLEKPVPALDVVMATTFASIVSLLVQPVPEMV
jgi:hypothetical protein